MLGHFEDRRRYDAALAAITDPDKREKFIAEWQDECSSVNDIGTHCHKLAKALMEQEDADNKGVGNEKQKIKAKS